jgi:hypothetical protein
MRLAWPGPFPNPKPGTARAVATMRTATPTHGYEPTREAAMAAFAKSWRRE